MFSLNLKSLKDTDEPVRDHYYLNPINCTL